MHQVTSKAFSEEFIKLAKEDTKKTRNTNTRNSLIGGFGAGATSALLLAPLDTVKDTMRSGGPGATKSFFKTVKNLYGQGGVRRFYQGAAPAVWKLGLGMGVTLGVAEFIKQRLEENEHKWNKRTIK